MNNQVITEISHVTTLTGSAKVRTLDGEIRDLKVGDVLQPGAEVILTDASAFTLEKGMPEHNPIAETPVEQQPSMPAMGAENNQTTAQINELQKAILSGQDPTQAFEAAAAGIPADAGGAGIGSGNSGFCFYCENRRIDYC
ncbi:retention module-containing protein [uncultured Tolumonas sp.]|uniref:retention module-containing protein n=1 Tax=uncultured Tolumonas sp. TaxID=263765 RepID=UPI002A0A1151|nr:retention module-containing protein [uncultured Tolumonas sp.]